jgi:formylglycine-generating enzyme required for sulfatase activity
MAYLSFKELRELSPASRRRYVRQIEDGLAGEFTIKNPESAAGELPSFEQVNSSIEFKLIPAGEFVFGFTEKEEASARAIANLPNLTLSEMRPARKVSVGPFLISRTPLLMQDARRFIDVSKLDEVFLAAVHNNPYAPASVQRETALSCAKKLGCRLPFEIEWEYACRANTRSLFIWGNVLPSERTLSEWLDYRRLPPGKWRENAFGLQLLFAGEWCMDEWRPSHDDGADVVPGVHVVKGGGSLFWPWQTPDEQFVWCLPAMRMPSTDIGGEGCAFRLVKALPES